MKSFLKSLVSVTIFFGGTYAEAFCQIYPLNAVGDSSVVTRAGSNVVSVAEGPSTDFYWYIPNVGTPGPITHISTGKVTLISGTQVVAQLNAQPQNWEIAEVVEGLYTIKAVNQNSYWTASSTINVQGPTGADNQKFYFMCE